MTIQEQLQNIEKTDRIGVMSHIVVGYPDLATAGKICDTMIAAGVDFIELQIPFSDPLADGSTIMAASEQALRGGTTVEECFMFMEENAKKTETPLLFMTYYNIIFRYGVEAFLEKTAAAGCKGLIVPDMPIDEDAHESFFAHAKNHNMPIIPVLAPENTIDRLGKIKDAVRGDFAYLPARKGVTGTGMKMGDHIAHEVTQIHDTLNMPVAVGFGISKGAHVASLKSSGAEIAVVGSAAIEAYNNGGIDGLREFMEEIITAAR